MLGKSPESKGDIRVKLNLTTQVVLYTKTNGPCTAVMWALTINITVLFIDQQAHQGGLKREGKESVYHKWSLTICDGCFDTLNSSKMRS